jgi:ribosomal protein S12 methylthiotransferase
VEDVLLEVSRLAEEGVKEINLIAQDSTAFGLERGENDAFIRLLESLDNIKPIEWVRLLYAYPDHITKALLRTMSQSKKIVPYLDVPLQHCVPRILKAMNRDGGSLRVRNTIDLIRSHIPDVVLRTSIITGFPGETQQEFKALLNFVNETEFDHLGVFAFSPETGTGAARLPGRISPQVAEQRRRTLLRAQRSISRRRLMRWVGKDLPVLVEGSHPETNLLLTGRLSTQAPEVDGVVLITSGTGSVGEMMCARITAAHDYDLEAELLGDGHRDKSDTEQRGNSVPSR